MSAAIVIVPVMVVIVAAAVLLVAVLAFPSRGRRVPGAPWADEILMRIAEQVGVLEPDKDTDTDEVTRVLSTSRTATGLRDRPSDRR